MSQLLNSCPSSAQNTGGKAETQSSFQFLAPPCPFLLNFFSLLLNLQLGILAKTRTQGLLTAQGSPFWDAHLWDHSDKWLEIKDSSQGVGGSKKI